MSASVPPLSSLESALFQAMSKAGLVYLLMLRLKRPIGAREIGDILGIHEQTASSYLRRLAKLNLVARCGRKRGYVVLGGWQLVLEDASQPPPAEKALPAGLSAPALDGPRDVSQAAPQETENTAFFSQYGAESFGWNAHEEGETQDFTAHAGVCIDAHAAQNVQDRAYRSADTAKFSQYPENTTKKSQYPHNVNTTTTSTTDINLIKLTDTEVEVVVDQTAKKPQNGAENAVSEVWEELISAGIGANERTRLLVRQPHVTPEYVKAHRLKLVASGKTGPKWAGLLVTILESGEPAPELNPNGHLADCDCLDCHGYRVSRSWEDP